MNSISVRLTISDDELYDNFIEPRKVNGDLPTLVLRLLTAYATNDDLAYEIDQFIDKDSDPDVCVAREAIMRAVARLNNVDAVVSQEIEALSAVDGQANESFDLETDGTVGADLVSDGTVFNNSDTQSDFADMSDFTDGVLSPSTESDRGTEPLMEFPKAWLDDSPRSIVADANSNIGTSTANTPSDSVDNKASSGNNLGSASTDNTVVLQSINALANQIATLTNAVTMLVTGGNVIGQGTMVAQNPQTGITQQGETSSADVDTYADNTQSVASKAQPAINLDNPVASTSAPVQSSVQEKQSMGTTQAKPTAPALKLENSDSQKQVSLSNLEVGTANTASSPVENSVENVENNGAEDTSSEDDYDIPSFMDDMLSGLV